MTGEKKQASWFDWTNLAFTVLSCAIGVVVTLRISRSADDLSQSGLFVASAGFLLEKDTGKQCAGVEIVQWLWTEKKLTPPKWMTPLMQVVANKGQGTTPGRDLAVAHAAEQSPTRCGAQSDSESVGSALLDAVAGGTPRLFIQIADEDQHDDAERLRKLMQSTSLEGAAVLVPGVQKVSSGLTFIQLRFVKSRDSVEANALAIALKQLTGQPIKVEDFSATYESRADVKPRTYELWYPKNSPVFSAFIRDANTDRRGEDYFSEAVKSVDLCEQLCLKDGRCKAYTFLPAGVVPYRWNGPSGPYCWLKQSIPPALRYDRMVSGVRRD